MKRTLTITLFADSSSAYPSVLENKLDEILEMALDKVKNDISDDYNKIVYNGPDDPHPIVFDFVASINEGE